ncbi:mitochondrial ribonuclease P catalytic subunit isoform X1 [Scophthalmus maximus]|uniref:Mitochondrial ribonuclease P catalytic subunit n=2 Tax=Scophthalmus maximus TaxID=52904 RepID=A0A8D3AI63_SCOMX|nr:mitochondrial ribonuclease P catalytic subunit isoform X1 [Scophthalmus maximus]
MCLMVFVNSKSAECIKDNVELSEHEQFLKTKVHLHNMGSTLLSKVRICFRPLKPHLAINTSLCEKAQSPPTARCLSTRDNNPNSGGRQTAGRNSGQTDGHGGVKYGSVRHRQGGLWEDSADGGGKSSTLKQRPSFPKSVFSAGTAKRTTEMLKRKAALASGEEAPDEELEVRATRGAGKVKPPDRPLSAAEWGKLKESLGNPHRFDIKMISALFTSRAELAIAKSLLTFVATETGTLSYELLLLYLTLCVRGGHDEEVFDVYDIMRGSFSSLETGATSLFIKSFSRTARWREAVDILQEVKKVFTPSSRNYGDLIAAAMLHGDRTTAWAFYDELFEKGLSPHPETWDALFKGARKTKEAEGEEAEAMPWSEHQERLLGILLHMRDNQIYPQSSLAGTIKTWFESLRGQKWRGNWTSATPKGLCRCCESELESIQLTAEEYQQLKDRVMTDIIQGRDIFTKTTPEELERFKAFVQRKPAFDVVVDGLNVANTNKDKSQLSATLLAVVSELDRQGLTVLVLGRKHMLYHTRSWDKHSMRLIQQKAHCFFTENISEDDPFLLYATLHSGNHCRFVSRDLMRDHKACLPDGHTRRLFFKWQRGHQLVVDGQVAADRRVRFQSIPSYDTSVQTSGDSWHIPYDNTGDRTTYEVPQQWLCLTQKH